MCVCDFLLPLTPFRTHIAIFLTFPYSYCNISHLSYSYCNIFHLSVLILQYFSPFRTHIAIFLTFPYSYCNISLHQTCKKFPPTEIAKLKKFPSKSLFSSYNDREFVKKRTAELEKYLTVKDIHLSIYLSIYIYVCV